MKKLLLFYLLIINNLNCKIDNHIIDEIIQQQKKDIKKILDEISKKELDKMIRKSIGQHQTSKLETKKQLVKEALLLKKNIKIKRELTQLTQRVKDLVETCHTMEQKEHYSPSLK